MAISESIDTQINEVVSTCRLRIAARRRFKMFRVTVVQSDRFTPQETHLEEFIPALCRCANERQKLGPSRGVWTKREHYPGKPGPVGLVAES